MNTTMRGWQSVPAALLLLGVVSTAAHAIPELQLYVEGATYDSEHESWVFEIQEGRQDKLRLWVIGNVGGPGGKGPISDVFLSMVYPDRLPDQKDDVTIAFTPARTDGFGGYSDSTHPGTPEWQQFNDQGDRPTLSDGRELASHGTYGQGWEWQEFLLGDFDSTDSEIGDFIQSFPSASGDTVAQINVYEVMLEGLTEVHFDAYNSVAAGNGARGVFAPFSHDAGTGTNQAVPAPGTLLLLGGGLALLGWGARRRCP